MTPFLKQIASLFYGEYKENISKYAFVFPNRRAGLFFQKYLADIAGKPLFSPTILTINDLFVQLSGKQKADHIGLLFELYAIYTRISASNETFDSFLHWGEMLLSDFDDVDKYMVDANKLFKNIQDLKEIDNLYDYLSEEQRAAIRTFWGACLSEKAKGNEQHFRSTWEMIFPIYTALRQSLGKQNKGYEGMIFREVVENLRKERDYTLPFEQLVFVGLNALSTSEEELLNLLREMGRADFYWDVASERILDKDNKASFFMAKNVRNYPSRMKVPTEETIKTEIEVIGIPSGIGGAKQVHAILEKNCQKGELNDDNSSIRTAVILPDEQLLMPVINAIPEKIKRINITMGYPLAGTPIASLFEYILSMHKNRRHMGSEATFYFRDVLPILNHRYVLATDNTLIRKLLKDITSNNRIYISSQELGQTDLLRLLFRPIENTKDIPDYLIEVLTMLNSSLGGQLSETEEETEKARQQTLNDVEQEFLFHYFATVNRMKEMMKEAKIDMNKETFFKLLKRITASITIPFHGEPLSGLQIMGVLETRSLDFDRIIVLSMNEGKFPQRKVANSFIPFNLRRGFGLPTYEHQDSIWAYHFYRLIHRAKQVSFIYDTRTNGSNTGEISRFIHQLRYHYDETPLKDKLVIYQVSSTDTSAISVPKTAAMMQNFNKHLSASSINSFLDCSLKFFFSHVEGIQEEDEISEDIKANAFGSILHRVMELLYKDFEGRNVSSTTIKEIQKNHTAIRRAINMAYAEVFFKSTQTKELKGKHFLIGEVIRKYVLKILETDTTLAPFRYLCSEKKITKSITLNNGQEVHIKGFIDRIDLSGDTLRIIDYKSGDAAHSFTDVQELFDPSIKDRPRAIMQVFLYSWLYQHTEKVKITPGIYTIKELYKKDFTPKINQKKIGDVLDFNEYRAEFETELTHCLNSLYDLSIPFSQTTNEKHCSFCTFKGICGK